MKRHVLVLLLGLVSVVRAGEEIGYVETFALSEDRAEALKELVPGTDEYYYYSCLHYQNTGQRELYKKTLDSWVRRHNGTVVPQARELMNRQALLDYERDPKKTLEYVRRELDLRFDHSRRTGEKKSGAPTRFDNARIGVDALLKGALQDPRTLQRIEDAGLGLVTGRAITPEQRRNLLSRLKRPDYPGLVEHIVQDLQYKGSRGFGHHPIHAKLLLEQLLALSRKEPALRNHPKFVNAYLAKLAPIDEVDLELDVQSREAYLDRVWTFVQTLDPVHNWLKANTLYNRLKHDREQAHYDKDRFMQYIRLPRDVPYLREEVRRKLVRGEHLAHLNKKTGLIALPPVGNEEPLVRDYLMHLMEDADSYDAYREWIREDFLKRVSATSKILNGIGDPEKWAAMLSASEYRELKERVDIQFAADNPKALGLNDPVQVRAYVKHVPTLIVKIFEINTFNYYRQTGKPLNLAINLDGLVASHEQQVTYPEAPERRVLRTFDFPQLSKRGVYVVELIGNGRSSRTLVQKGRLGLLQSITPGGHAFVVLDEANRKLGDAKIWLQGREFTAEEDGRIVIPFSTQPRSDALIVQHGTFATLTRFQHKAEQYDLHAGIYVDRESLLRREKAQVIVRPVLRVSNQPTSLKLLEDVRLVIRSTDQRGIASEKEIADFALHEDRDSVYEFKVPEDLSGLEFRLRARVQNISRNKKEDLDDGVSFTLNQIEKSPAVQDLHVSHAKGGYILEMRGKNGEARAGQGVQMWFKHRLFRDEVQASLQTDAAGRCHLGLLNGIERFRAKGPMGTDHTWPIRRDAYLYSGELHGIAGDTLRVPLVYEGSEDVALVSLLDQKRGRFVRDWRKALRVKDGFLELRDLPAGNYSLYVKPDARAISVRLTEGETRYGFALSEKRALQTRRLPPLHLAKVSVTKGAVRLKLANATPFTRVHVFASRYMPAHDVFARLAFTGHPGLLEQRWTRTQTFYESGRKIGDEYRYILDRQLAKRYPGNMLERPGLLLNPWAIRDTGAGREQLESGAEYAGKAAKEPPAGAAPGQARGGRAKAAGGYANLDFLADPTVALLNLKPDADGIIAIDKAQLQGKPQLSIMFEDPISSLFKVVALDDSALETRELRLVKGLDTDKLYAEQKLVSVVGKKESLTIEDVTASTFETYDSLAGAYRLLGTLSGNATLNEFGFALRWPEMKPEERRRLYSKYACHELSFFLYHKDAKFFKAVIAPYLKSKKDKTFMDRWLLAGDLSGYLEPWRYARLNTVERVLLGRRLRGQAVAVERDLRERNDLIPPDIEGFNRRFDTAVQTSALEAEGELADRIEEVMLREKGKSEVAFGRLGGLAGRASGSSNGRAVPKPAARALSRFASKRKEQTTEELTERLVADADGDGVDENGAGLVVAGGFHAYFDSDGETRGRQRRFFQKLDKTKEWAENNYYQLPIEQQLAGLVPVNEFWAEYAAHDGKTPFVSRHFTQTARSFTEMMLALAVLDLSFEAGDHGEDLEGVAFTLTASDPVVVFHKEIREAAKAKAGSPVLVSQHFFRVDDRYRHENNERFEKYVTDEFLRHVVYGCQVILTNPSANRQKLHLLLQLPLGAMPVSNGFYTRGIYQVVEPYGTKTAEYYFYFPGAGKYPHYPVTVAREEKVIGAEKPFVFNVVPQLSRIDKTSWAWISQNGTPEQVVAYLGEHNIHRVKLADIAWRMKDRAFFKTVTTLAEARLTYDQALWSYGVHHNDPATAREFLRHSPFANRCGLHLVSPLLVLDPVERLTHQHLEYMPLVNARAHQVGRKRKILNHAMRAQYQRLMKVLSYKASLGDADELAVTYYLALQDRVEEALNWFARVDRGKTPEALPYDYMSAYLGLYRGDLAAAKALAARYKNHPVDRWRHRFVNLQGQLEELTRGVAEAADAESREQTQAQLAATEPALDLRVEASKIRIDYRNLRSCRLDFYPMDIELLFSRNPFLQKDSAQFSFLRPVLTRTLELPAGKETTEVDIPKAFSTRNVMIEAVAAGLRKSQAYYANTLRVDVTENYGHLRVTDADTRKPLPKVYVKVYARTKNGRVQFFKDGYTDFRGRFDYVSLNTNEIDNTERLSLLILSEAYGAVVREAAPPKR